MEQKSLCKYTWEVDVYIVIIDERQMSLNIWPKASTQITSIEDMILII